MFRLHFSDVAESSNILRLIERIRPDEIYGPAAQSHVAVSFELPEYTANVDVLRRLRILEAVRALGLQESTRFYQASTSGLYDQVMESAQNEDAPFCPRSPYRVAKPYAHWITINYREAYGMHASSGVLFYVEPLHCQPELAWWIGIRSVHAEVRELSGFRSGIKYVRGNPLQQRLLLVKPSRFALTCRARLSKWHPCGLGRGVHAAHGRGEPGGFLAFK